MHTALVDQYGRVVDSLRVLVTSRCNYRCIFCHKEGVTGLPRETLNAEDYGFISRVSSKLGVVYHKITGGEPLLRDDIVEIVKNIKPSSREISLVTNGSLLLEKARDLANAGLDRVNVSLHALSREVYGYVTGGPTPVDRVIAGIDRALDYGIKVKINFLAMKSNVNEFFKVLGFAEKRGINVNLIELIPLGMSPSVYAREHVSLEPILKYLENNSVTKYYRELHNRPVYVLSNGVKVEVVVGYGNYFFCNKCSRLRLTPDGYLKPCLYVENLKVSIVEAVKARSEESLIRAFQEATMLRKPYFTHGE